MERIVKQLVLLLSFISFTFVYQGQALKWQRNTCMNNALKFVRVVEKKSTCHRINYNGMIKDFPNVGISTCQRCSVEAEFSNKRFNHEVKVVNALFLFTLMSEKESFSTKVVKKSGCSSWRHTTIQITCDIEENLPYGTPCISHHQCAGDNTICNSTFMCDCVENGLQLNGICFKGNKTIGDPCVLSGQCAGYNTVCNSRRQCSCKDGYRQADKHCQQIAVGDACKSNDDCYWSGTICLNKVCSCKEDSIYIEDERKCLKGNIELGQECEYHQQCAGTKFAWLCTGINPGRKICSCLKGLIKRNNEECVRGNLPVGAYCNYNMQCEATPNASICSDHSCSCKPGYIQKGNNCIEGNLQIGAYCNHDLQCVATANASTCFNHSCSCDPGFVQQGSNCIEELSTNPQAITQEAVDSSNGVGVTMGALLGGLVLGALIVLAVVVILYHKRNTFQKTYGKNEQSAVSNQAYDSEMRIEPHTKNQKRSVLYSNVENESVQPKVSLVMPICKQMDSVNIKADSKDDIYNHLNEKEGDERDDTYDHAHPVQGACLMPSDEDAYMHVQMTDGSDINDKTIENQDAEDNYFTLEKEQT